ncbi:hypothetical protein DYB32_006345 [Aphanomyces invadans]|uniref:Uncharacterized protein n=1 Tax=Aphanomyces invadans TaxID=157072 RepID=A0A418AXT9_9STRA|nr:hypothetical protein DYB32_006345 [Aphanomyces invadans]
MSASSPSLRPKSASAAVVATCASAPTLKTALTSPSRAVIPATDRPSSCSSNNQHDEQTKAHRGDGRLLKSSKAQQRETPARLPQLKAIEAAMRDFAQPSNRKPLNNAMASAPSPVESSSSSMIVEPAAARQWISDDVRLRQVRRGFAHVQQEVQVHHKTEMVLKHQGVGKAIPPRPNERHNLAHQVPYKAVMDLRRSWDPHMKELHPTRARPPTCYDLVRICAFCAQFVQESERYRPVGGVSATDVQASQTSATNRCMTTVEENGMNDPFACDPILDGDDDADSETAMLLASRCSIGGVIGRNIRYQLQNTHTVRNLSEAEWDVISIAKHQHVAEFNGEMVPTVNDIRRSPMSMKRLLMDATKLAPLTESSNHSDRPSPTATDRRQSTEEPAAHCNVYR